MQNYTYSETKQDELLRMNITSMSINVYYIFYDETRIGGNKKVKIKMILSKTLGGKLNLHVEESSVITRWANSENMGIYFNARKNQLYKMQQKTFFVLVQTEHYNSDYFLLGYNFFLPAISIAEVMCMSKEIKNTINSSVEGY